MAWCRRTTSAVSEETWTRPGERLSVDVAERAVRPGECPCGGRVLGHRGEGARAGVEAGADRGGGDAEVAGRRAAPARVGRELLGKVAQGGEADGGDASAAGS